MEAQQCVKLTGTNSSIDLITLIIRARQGRRADREIRNDQFLLRFNLWPINLVVYQGPSETFVWESYS